MKIVHSMHNNCLLLIHTVVTVVFGIYVAAVTVSVNGLFPTFRLVIYCKCEHPHVVYYLLHRLCFFTDLAVVFCLYVLGKEQQQQHK